MDPTTEVLLDLNNLQPLFVSRTHFTDDELHTLEESLESSGAIITYDITEAKIIMSRVTSRTRLLFDLRIAGLNLEEVHEKPNQEREKVAVEEHISIDDSTTASEGEETITKAKRSMQNDGTDDTLIRVISFKWYEDSQQARKALSFDDYTTLLGRSSRQTSDSKPLNIISMATTPKLSEGQFAKPPSITILDRAKEDASERSGSNARPFKRKFGERMAPAAADTNASWAAGHKKTQYAHLLHTTTSEEDHGYSNDLPEPPPWALSGIKYACQRSTPRGSPNEVFISQLRKIKLARVLTSDEIGVRAYSTSIAALLAYPYKFTSPREILRLPGCDAKIANLFVEWSNTGQIKAVVDIDADRDLTILRTFYDIWGVGSLTAREFYYDHGWQDLDDLVEYNWQGLSRVQQVGVKYYDEFLEKIPRVEVEKIGRVVHEHAVKVRDADIQTMVVGGYRRGKEESGDVDIIVSHPDESKTLNIITDIVALLDEEEWITHTLLLSLNSTRRDQQTLPFRSGNMHGGHGFDNLDKAFVVWQDPNWPTKVADLEADPRAKNQNIHRRVDIIIAPWRTVGCAVLGWSGGTTFQRDIRRYVKHLYSWKFDSSGVRDRSNGEVLDLEGFHRYDGKLGSGRAKTMLEAEKRVFEGLKLEYIEPTQRCTD